MSPAPRPLGRVARRSLRKLCATVTPQLPELGIDLDPIVAFVEEFRAHLPRLLALLFPVGLLLLEYGTLLFGFSWRRFSRLDPARAERYVRAWIRSGFWARRELIKGVKGLCLCYFYSDERVCAALGYFPREQVKTVAAARLARYGHELAPRA